MSIELLNKDGKKTSTTELNGEVFTGKVSQNLIQEVVKMQLAGRRSGNASTKTRSEIRGSNAKPWRQKGTGRARAGTKKSPLWRSGGTIFGPKPRDYSYKVPKKVAKAALRSAVQFKANEGKMKVVDSIELAEPKTKFAVEFFDNASVKGGLIVIGSDNANLTLGARNLKGFKVIKLEGLNVYDVLRFDELIMTKEAFDGLDKAVAKS